MAQFARPDSIITAGSWTGAATNIDETTASDVDFIFSQNNPNDAVEVGLSDISDPSASGGHVLRVRLTRGDADGTTPSASGTATSYRIRLLQGATQITDSGTVTAPTSWTTVTATLTSGEADSITDYSDLRVEITGTGGGGSTTNRRNVAVSWAELEVPDPPPQQNLTRTAADTVAIGADSVARVIGLDRSASDTSAIGADTATATVLGARLRVYDVEIEIPGSTAAEPQNYTRSAVDNLSASDAVNRIVGAKRSASDLYGVSDSLARIIGIRRTATDSTTVSDTLVRRIGVIRQAIDSTGVSDTLTRLIAAKRQAVDATSLTDSIAAAEGFRRTATDTTAVTDTITILRGAARQAIDTTSVTDSVARIVGFTRQPAESIPTTDVLARILAAYRQAIDTTTVTDLANVAGQIITRTAVDTLTVTDQIAVRLGLTRQPVDTTTISDTVVRLGVFSRSALDILTTSDFVNALRRGPPQFLRPDADLIGNWHGEDARTTDLYTSIDDSPFSDATYIESPDNPISTDVEEFSLLNVFDPDSSNGHILRYRYGGDGIATLVVELRQGTTVIASWTHVDPGSPTLAEQTLTAEQADAITDYDDLRVRVRAA